MMMGKPVVVTRNPSLADLVEDGVTGLLIEPGNEAQLAAAIDRLCADPALRTRFGAAGRARILAEFSIDAMVEGNLAVYRRVLGALK